MPSSPESPPPQRTRAPVKLVPEDTAAQHVLPLGPRTRLSPVASPEWLLAPTPDSPRSHADDAACSTWTTSWERARLALTAPRTVGKKGRMLSGMRKVGANGCGAWRKEENMCQWSGECNVEDMEELQLDLDRVESCVVGEITSGSSSPDVLVRVERTFGSRVVAERSERSGFRTV
ncbi:hypothetical protein K438DRAFT_2031237 [Mycena galopus ATCC 62051]|nr:hypothetical protein K438DRAFT_2031237 [Mycena galopus ATCC 62051]